MLRKTLYFLCFCYQLTNCIVGADDESDCDICTFFAQSSLLEVAEKFQRFEPISIREVIPPCNACEFSGLSTAVVTEGAKICSFPTADGGRQVKFKVTVPTFTLKCTCEIPCNPKRIVDEFAQPIVSGCSEVDIAEGTKTALAAKYPTVSMADAAKATACTPLLVADMGCSNDILVTDTIELSRNNTDITFTSWISSEGFVEQVTDVVIEDLTVDSAKCGTGDIRFKQACECLLATNFIRNTVVSTIVSLVRCNNHAELKRNKILLQHLIC